MDRRICFVGDSFVNGMGDPDLLGWVGRICAGRSLTLYNLGVRRQTSAEIAARWSAEVACRCPPAADNRLVFSFGVNDCTLEQGQLRVDPLTSLVHTRQILKSAQRLYPVLMIGPPPIADPGHNQRIAQLSAQMASVCAERSVPYLDVFSTLINSSIWMREVEAGDGAHPGAQGYQELAILINQWPAWLDWWSISGG
jgi:lysophospholipase L1-like esterase